MAIIETPPSVPPDLSASPNWVVWRYEARGNQAKPAKAPYCPVQPGSKAAVDKPSTWASADTAKKVFNDSGFKGIGFVLTSANGLTVIDLDKCRDLQSGSIEPWAAEIIDRLKSFTEVSPSGTGVHIWIKAKLDGGGRRNGPIEIYSDRRFIAFTGDLLPGSPETIEDRQQTLDAWLREVFPARTKPRRMERTRVLWGTKTKPVSRFPQCSDEDVVGKAERSSNGAIFRSLFHDGDCSAYDGDHSRADQALCGLLAYWTNDNPDQMDRLFRRSALMRSKWDQSRGELTYGDKTIQTAIEGRL